MKLVLYTFMFIFFCQQVQAQDMSSQIVHTDVSDDFLLRVDDIFSQQNSLVPQDLSLTIGHNSEIGITFLGENAGFKNSLGYFLLNGQGEIFQESLIFANTSLQGQGGNLLIGDTVNLGNFSEDTMLGFYIQANGFKNRLGTKYYTTEGLNPDGVKHVASYYDTEENRVVYGFEDHWGATNPDYNDLLISVQSTQVEVLASAALDSGIYFDQTLQELHSVDGVVTMNVAPFAKVTGLDDVVMYATDPSALENVTFIGQDNFQIESNTGVEVVVAITELTNGNESVPISYSLDGQGHQIFTAANQTHKQIHQITLATFFKNMAEVIEGDWAGQIVVTISHY